MIAANIETVNNYDRAKQKRNDASSKVSIAQKAVKDSGFMTSAEEKLKREKTLAEAKLEFETAKENATAQYTLAFNAKRAAIAGRVPENELKTIIV